MKLKSIPESIRIYGSPIKGCEVPESEHKQSQIRCADKMTALIPAEIK